MKILRTASLWSNFTGSYKKKSLALRNEVALHEREKTVS